MVEVSVVFKDRCWCCVGWWRKPPRVLTHARLISTTHGFPACWPHASSTSHRSQQGRRQSTVLAPTRTTWQKPGWLSRWSTSYRRQNGVKQHASLRRSPNTSARRCMSSKQCATKQRHRTPNVHP